MGQCRHVQDNRFVMPDLRFVQFSVKQQRLRRRRPVRVFVNSCSASPCTLERRIAETTLAVCDVLFSDIFCYFVQNTQRIFGRQQLLCTLESSSVLARKQPQARPKRITNLLEYVQFKLSRH
jgi:hypothetical protein